MIIFQRNFIIYFSHLIFHFISWKLRSVPSSCFFVTWIQSIVSTMAPISFWLGNCRVLISSINAVAAHKDKSISNQ